MLNITPAKSVYIIVFALTALVCFGAIARARKRLDDPDTRWGLVSLLALSGFWAAFHVGRFVAPTRALKLTFYVLGLSVGLATVGAWLYFCLAYAGKQYHKRRSLRVGALVGYLSIISIKFTSPIHGLYFSTAVSTVPFRHLTIQFGVLHWAVTGVAYALSAAGFYVLFDLFEDSKHASSRLAFLVGLAGLPVVFDLAAHVTPRTLLTLNYEPIGVGLFALGVLYVADGSFVAVQQFGREQLLDELEEGILLLDSDAVIRDVNETAAQLFPALDGSVDTSVSTVAPEIAGLLPIEGPEIIQVDGSDTSQYCLVSKTRLGVGQMTVGQALVFTDITTIENQRLQLERYQSQLDDFAAAITHELRNTINIVQQHLELIEAELDPETDETLHWSTETSMDTLGRMSGTVSDLATLARYGSSVDSTTAVDVEQVASEAFETVASEKHSFAITADTVEADRSQLYRLFERLFEFAIDNGATRLDFTQDDGELVLISDGESLAGTDADKLLAYGEAVPDARSGMALPVVKTLAETLGWTVDVDTTSRDEVRIVVRY